MSGLIGVAPIVGLNGGGALQEPRLLASHSLNDPIPSLRHPQDRPQVLPPDPRLIAPPG